MLKRAILKYTSGGLRDSLRNLRYELHVMRMHHKGVRRAARFRHATALKLHLGCGSNIKQGFINIDMSDAADMPLDLREVLPFSDDSCALIYSEHFLEHLEYPEAVAGLLRECHRILMPGGLFSVGVPDTEWPLMEYAGVRKDGYFDLAKRHWHPSWCVTELDHINYHFRQGQEHKYAYDFKTLQRTLMQAGFVQITRRASNPEMDQASWAAGTLYVEAFKQ